MTKKKVVTWQIPPEVLKEVKAYAKKNSTKTTKMAIQVAAAELIKKGLQAS